MNTIYKIFFPMASLARNTTVTATVMCGHRVKVARSTSCHLTHKCQKMKAVTSKLCKKAFENLNLHTNCKSKYNISPINLGKQTYYV